MGRSGQTGVTAKASRRSVVGRRPSATPAPFVDRESRLCSRCGGHAARQALSLIVAVIASAAAALGSDRSMAKAACRPSGK